MMSIEMRGGSGGVMVGAGVSGIDPSNLHLKKELTQIRKAARVLRDPGTTSSWRSPLNSSRSVQLPPYSAAKHHYVHHHQRNLSHSDHHLQKDTNGQGELIDGNGIASPHDTYSQHLLQIDNNNVVDGNRGQSNGNNGSVSGKGKEKKVFLYNWKSQKSGSERSRQIGSDDVKNRKDEGSSSTQESVDLDSLSDARNGGGIDTKSDTYLSDRHASAFFKCKDADFTPSIRRTIKKKSKRSNYSSAILRHHDGRLWKQMASRGTRRVAEGFPHLAVGRDDLGSLVDQSDDTEDYCNSEDLRRVSAGSPLLARLMNKGLSHPSTKFLRNTRKEDDSISYSTPALSISSYNKYGVRNPSTVESWDATTASFNDADDEVDDQLDLPGRQGCGIPCYWSRRSTPKSRAARGDYSSPSLSDTLRRKGSSIFCGSQTMYRRRRHGSALVSNKRRLGSRAVAQGLIPLLTNGDDGPGGSSLGSGNTDDELSTNFGELDLEALSRLDGRRWSSSCRSQDGLELVALNGEGDEEGTPENIRSLSHKYRPLFFEELIGQNIVVQSLMSAISRGRIAPVYLFQGPRGTGKTSAARIFAAALNCLATEETKPCGVCSECTDFISGKTRDLIEVDGSNKKDTNKVRYLLKTLPVGPLSTVSRYRVFVVDECHLLPSKTWLALLRFLEDPLPHAIFVFITTDIENVPRAILSRCQKYLFNKIRDGDIVNRLKKIAADENLDVESDALELIALNADGSLRDAETMLDQLSLLGKRITTSLVNELIGVVSDEKLLELLDAALASDTAETVRRARELMDAGVDPIVIMSQMAALIMDIISGTYSSVGGKSSAFLGASLSGRELERLKHSLKLLSEAEKQLRVSNERSTWFTATLLQLGSVPSPDPTHSGSSRRQSSKTTEEEHLSMYREVMAQKQQTDVQFTPRRSASPPSFQRTAPRNSANKQGPLSQPQPASFNSKLNHEALTISDHDLTSNNISTRSMIGNVLDSIWVQCIEKCHSKNLKQLLHTHGKLLKVSEEDGVFVAYIAFRDRNIKSRAERFLSSITNSFEVVLRRNVEVKIFFSPVLETAINGATNLQDSVSQLRTDTTIMMDRENKSNADGNSNFDLCQEPDKLPRRSFNGSDDHLVGSSETIIDNAKIIGSKEDRPGIPVQRIESIIHEQRLETAWLQAMEKGTSGSINRLKPERNQVLPQDGIYHQNNIESLNSEDPPSHHWEDDLNHEMRAALKIKGGTPQKDQIVNRMDHYPISPSLLHNSSFASNFSKENMGYESSSGAGGCSGFLCWNNAKPRRRGKVKQGTPVRSRKVGRLSWFGECARSGTDNRFRR